MSAAARAIVAVLLGFGLLLTVAPAGAGTPAPFPVGADADYQLGGAAPVPDHVQVVVRDREAAPLPGRYNVCYVNAFQTQPNERGLWRRHPRLLLRHRGRPVVDQGWGETLLDLRTPAKRKRLLRLVRPWIAGCAASGYAAVEFDNLDSFTRSRRLIRPRATRAYARLLVRAAHAHGLAAAQKNWAEWDGRVVGFDFAIAESCGQYRECGSYVARYGGAVLVVEYTQEGFDRACASYGDRLGIVLRDRDLTPNGPRAWC